MRAHTRQSCRIEDMLRACEDAAAFDDTDSAATPRKRTFNKWERDFLESVREQFDERGRLSDRQEQVLMRLYDKT